MNGIEKITQRIAGDTQAEIDGILAQAQAQADAITAQARAQADKDAADLKARSVAAAAEREERLASVAQLEGRKLILAAKQEMLTKTFQKALEELCALPDDQYITLLANLAAKAARTGREKVILSQRDRNRVGKAAVTAANELLAKAVAPKLPDELTDSKAGALLDKVVTGATALMKGTAMLTLAEETRPIQGGLVLSDGDIEVNCTFETLVRLQRDEMAAEIATELFQA